MINFNELTALLGWCCVINLMILSFTTLMLVLCQSWICKVHSRLLNIKVESLPELYFKYLANYKVLVMLLNVSPYLSLKIIS